MVTTGRGAREWGPGRPGGAPRYPSRDGCRRLSLRWGAPYISAKREEHKEDKGENNYRSPEPEHLLRLRGCARGRGRAAGENLHARAEGQRPWRSGLGSGWCDSALGEK